ncbi:hypothetical protein FCJ61_04100 [Burkholderia metallica]|uniref:hypothetical protein n=1 Tax=Burkholderia TaxID=32008 RepID=UPI00157AB111|nr:MULTISPECIES: hypothetical protein [Burkholderia]MBG0879405.1 hypothetical protein [Burkholderia sp. 9775_39]MBG0884546.1 hypothetical protein [Burkholderia sp. 9773_38]NTZ82220.1 hypothetical protein [Burkholderia metallica]
MNVKPGDLAVVHSNPVPTVNGQIVEVVDAGTGHPDWGPGWLVKNAAIMSQLGHPVFMPDSMLRRIGGVPVTDDISDEVIA